MPTVLEQIEALDPVRDAQQICFLSCCFDFALENQKALEFALFRTYAVPSIGALLDATGEFAQRPQKRYDDTVLLISEFVENGLDTPRARQALERMNAIHGRFKISNDDYLYVLSTFIYEPIRWNERFGWRKFVEKERLAAFHLWREIGRRMGIADIPTDYHELEAFNRAYEEKHFQFSEESRRVGEATLGLFESWYPRPLRPIVRQVALALMDAPVLRAFGLPRAHVVFRVAMPIALKAFALARRILPKQRTPILRSRLKYRSYPNGHVIDELGPEGPPVKRRPESRSG